MADNHPQTKIVYDWRSEIYAVDPPPAEEVIYEFSSGSKFYEQFHPTNGPYKSEE